MTDKIKNSQLRKMVFNNIDENKNGKIDSSETKLGNIFNLKDGDKKIKRKDFDRNLAINFLNARKEGKDVSYKANIDGDAMIQKCYKCEILQKDASVDINGENNKAIIQHGENHMAEINGGEIMASLPAGKDEQIEPDEIELCVECKVEITDESININGTGNTLVYQNEKRTQIIESNQENVHIENKNEVKIDDCEDCTKEDINNKAAIDGNDNHTITQFGDNNKANIRK